MSKGSVGGRGRGWLKLNKNQQIPGSNISNSNTHSESVHSTPVDENLLADAPEYSAIISRIKELDVNDDGIKFNQKIKYIIEYWQNDCKTCEELGKSFDSLFQASLSDEDLASKLTILAATRTFLNLKIHETRMLSLFLPPLQQTLEGGKTLQKTNPIVFRNSVRILGGYFNKARSSNGDQFMFLIGPLVSYLAILLESDSTEDLKLFTSQLLLNGDSLKLGSKENLVELLNNARMVMVSNLKLTKEGRLWLLLCIDLASRRFELPDREIEEFYSKHLNDETIFNVQVQNTPSILHVETQDNQNLKKYQSNISVLQCSNKLETSTQELTSQLSNTNINESISSNSTCRGSTLESPPPQDLCNMRTEPPQNPGKHGRPILGVGVRLIRDKSANDSSSRDCSNSKGWNNKPKSGDWSEKKTSKGYEHDDRFDYDYS